MRIRLPFINRVFVIGFIDLNRIVVGLDSTSFCEEGKQILMLDYDTLSLEEVRADIRGLQHKFGLPAMYIFSSSKDKYHAYCMTCFKFHQVMLITFSSKSDKNHKDCLLANKRSTLRITEKKGKESRIRFIEKIIPGDRPTLSPYQEIHGAEEILKKVILRTKTTKPGISLSNFIELMQNGD